MKVEGKEVNQAIENIKPCFLGAAKCNEDETITFKHLASSLSKNWLWKKEEIKLLKETIIKNRNNNK
jgi:hypothetical protein